MSFESNSVVVWGKPNCVYCELAKTLLKQRGIEYKYKQILNNNDMAEFLEDTDNARTVPQIIINGVLIGGLDKLKVKLGI